MNPRDAAEQWKGRHTEGRRAKYVDLVRGCSDMGVDVEYSDELSLLCGLTQHGEDSDERTVVTINRSATRHRRMFTLAHEIGHVEAARLQLSATNEEQWCDRFAAALVLTTPRQNEVTGPPSLETLLAFAERHDMGLAASLVTLRNHERWRAALLVLNNIQGTWILVNTHGLQHSVADHLKVPRRGPLRGRIGRAPTRRQVTLELGRRPVQIVADTCSVGGNTVLIFLTDQLTRRLSAETTRRREQARTAALDAPASDQAADGTSPRHHSSPQRIGGTYP